MLLRDLCDTHKKGVKRRREHCGSRKGVYTRLWRDDIQACGLMICNGQAVDRRGEHCSSAKKHRYYQGVGEEMMMHIPVGRGFTSRRTFPSGEGGPLAVDEVIFNATYRNLIRLASQSTFPKGEGETDDQWSPLRFITLRVAKISLIEDEFHCGTPCHQPSHL